MLIKDKPFPFPQFLSWKLLIEQSLVSEEEVLNNKFLLARMHEWILATLGCVHVRKYFGKKHHTWTVESMKIELFLFHLVWFHLFFFFLQTTDSHGKQRWKSVHQFSIGLKSWKNENTVAFMPCDRRILFLYISKIDKELTDWVIFQALLFSKWASMIAWFFG